MTSHETKTQGDKQLCWPLVAEDNAVNTDFFGQKKKKIHTEFMKKSSLGAENCEVLCHNN